MYPYSYELELDLAKNTIHLKAAMTAEQVKSDLHRQALRAMDGIRAIYQAAVAETGCAKYHYEAIRRVHDHAIQSALLAAMQAAQPRPWR